MRYFLPVALVLLASAAAAQPALQTLVTNELAEPYGVTVDTKNNFYLTDSVNNRIAKYNPNAGSLTNLAGVLGEAGDRVPGQAVPRVPARRFGQHLPPAVGVAVFDLQVGELELGAHRARPVG